MVTHVECLVKLGARWPPDTVTVICVTVGGLALHFSSESAAREKPNRSGKLSDSVLPAPGNSFVPHCAVCAASRERSSLSRYYPDTLLVQLHNQSPLACALAAGAVPSDNLTRV